MNKIYQTLWNVVRQCVVVVNEKTRTGHQGARSSIVLKSADKTRQPFHGRLTPLAIGVLLALSFPVGAKDLNGYVNNGEMFTILPGEQYLAYGTPGLFYGYAQWTSPVGKEPLLENFGTITVRSSGVHARQGKIVNYGNWTSEKRSGDYGADAPATNFANFDNQKDAHFHAKGADSPDLNKTAASASGQVFENAGKLIAEGGGNDGIGLEIFDQKINSNVTLIEGKLHNTETGTVELRGGGKSAYGLYVHDGAELINDGEMTIRSGWLTDSYGLKMTDDTVWTNNGTVIAERMRYDDSGVISAGKFINNNKFELTNSADKSDSSNPTASFKDMEISPNGQVVVNNAVLKITGEEEGLINDGILDLNSGSMLHASVLHNKGTLTFADDALIRVGKFINEVDDFVITQFNGLNEQDEDGFAHFIIDNRADNLIIDQVASASTYNSGTFIINDMYGGNVINTGDVTYNGPVNYAPNACVGCQEIIEAWYVGLTNSGHIRWNSKIPNLTVTQTDPNAVLETYVSGLIDYSKEGPGKWNENRVFRRMSATGWDLRGNSTVISLVDFATGNDIGSGVPITPFITPNVKITAGTLVILDDFTLEAQAYIERMLRSQLKLPNSVKIEFPNTGDKDQYVHNVVFNVANTGAFVSGGGEGAVVPYPVRSEKDAIVIGDSGADIPGSIGLAALTGTYSIKIEDGKTLLFKPWNDQYKLFDGKIWVNDGILQLGLETVEKGNTGGKGGDVWLGKKGQLIVNQSDGNFTIDSLSGTGELKLVAGQLTIKKLEDVRLGDLHINEKNGLTVESGSGSLSSVTVDGGELNLNMSPNEGSLESIENHNGTATLVLDDVTQWGAPITNNGGTTSVTFQGGQTTVAADTGRISNQNGKLAVAGDLLVKGLVKDYSTIRNESVLNTSGNWILMPGADYGYRTDFMVLNNASAEYTHTGSLTLTLDESARGETGAIRNDGTMTIDGKLFVNGARSQGLLLNADRASLTFTDTVELKAAANENDTALLNKGTMTIHDSLSAKGGSQQNAIALKNEFNINIDRQESGIVTFQGLGGTASGAHGIHNISGIDNTGSESLNLNIEAGSVAGAYGLMNEGSVTLKKGFDFQFSGGQNRDAVAAYNAKGATMTMAPLKTLDFNAGSADGAHALVNHGAIEVGGFYSDTPYAVPDVDAKASGSLDARASGIVNRGTYSVRGDTNDSGVMVQSTLTASGGISGSYGFHNEAGGTLQITNSKLYLKGGQGTDAYGLYNEGSLEINNGTLWLQSQGGFLQAYGGNGTLKLINAKVESDLSSIFRYAGADASMSHAVINQNGDVFEVDASAFATGELIEGGISEVASFLANQGSLTIDIRDSGWSQSAVDKFQAALNGISGSTIKLNMKADGTKDLEDARALEFNLANVSAYLQSNGTAGTRDGLIFGYDDLASEKTSVKIGGAASDFDAWVGFRSEKGATDIELDGNQRFTLLGDGSHVSDAVFNVKNGTLYLGVEGIKATQGGSIGALTIGSQGRLEVAAVDGIYDAPSLTIQNGELNNKGHLRLSGQLDMQGGQIHNTGSIVAQSFTNDVNAEIKNSGTISIAETDLRAAMHNDGTLKVGGTLEIGASSVLTNTGTVLAQSINFVGGYRFTEGAQLSIGEAAMDEFLMTHPDVAKSLLDAGETLSPEVVAAVYGMMPYSLMKQESGKRSTAAQADSSYLTFGDAAERDGATLIATKQGGLKLDASKTDNFGSLFSLAGVITGDHVVSATGDNRTIDVRSQTVSNKATLTLLDASYLGATETLVITKDSTLKVKDFESEALGYHAGALVVQGSVSNDGTMDSADASAVIVTGNGLIENGGEDDGASLTLEGDAQYVVDGGHSRYDEVRLEGGTIHVTDGFFGVGAARGVEKFDAVLSLANRLDNRNGTLMVGTLKEKHAAGRGDVIFGHDSTFVVSTGHAEGQSLLSGTGHLDVEEGSTLVVAESSWGKHRLTSGLDMDEAVLTLWNKENLVNQTAYDTSLGLYEGDLMMNVGRDINGDGSIDTSIQALSTCFALPEVINGLIDKESMIERRSVNSKDADIAFIERMLDGAFVGKLSDGTLDVFKAAGLWNSATQLSAASGADAYALQAARHILSDVEEHLRNASDQNGSAFWVMVDGRRDKADKLESSGEMKGGFEADTYGMTFGVDAVRSNDWVAGASFHYEDGTLDSLGSYTKTNTDVGIFGFEAYAQKRMGEASVMGYAAYAKNNGDVTQTFADLKNNSYRVNGDLRADIYTLGLRGDCTFAAGSNWSITPHAGLRYTHLDYDGYDVKINDQRAFAVDDHSADIIDLPIGMSVAGLWRSGGWTLSPHADISVIPSFGDTETAVGVAATTFAGADTYDLDLSGHTFVEGALGLTAVHDAHTLNLSYRGLAGDRGTQGHSLSFQYQLSF